jgi:hypothetical protein
MDYSNPLRLLITIVCSTFVAEALIMILLILLPPLTPPIDVLFDSILLVALIFPALFLFSFRPLLASITELKHLEINNKRLIRELQAEIQKVKALSGLLPICAGCKKIRDDEGYWHQVEVYIRNHSEAEFSHGLCPECEKSLYPELSE